MYLLQVEIQWLALSAIKCIKLRPSWGKAYCRKGAALVGLGQAGEGVKAYLAGLQANQSGECHTALKEGLREAKEDIKRAQQRYEDMWGSKVQETDE